MKHSARRVQTVTFPPINPKSLKDQVYEYLRLQIQQGNLRQGDTINMELTSSQLGVSRTPLRDALLQLEIEGFVTISPRRGVVVNTLSLNNIRDYYQVIGALESTAFLTAAETGFSPADIAVMKELNEHMKQSLEAGDFFGMRDANRDFHNLYLERCGNAELNDIVNHLKRRLQDFIPGNQWLPDWETASVAEHFRLVEILETQSVAAAAAFIRDVHWSFVVQEKFIRRYYRDSEAEKPAPGASRRSARPTPAGK